MSNILLSEATTEQLMDQIIKNVRFCVLCVEKPGSEGEFIEGWQGSYIEKAGCIQALNAKLRYDEKMQYKSAYNDEAEEYFGEDDSDEEDFE